MCSAIRKRIPGVEALCHDPSKDLDALVKGQFSEPAQPHWSKVRPIAFAMHSEISRVRSQILFRALMQSGSMRMSSPFEITAAGFQFENAEKCVRKLPVIGAQDIVESLYNYLEGARLLAAISSPFEKQYSNLRASLPKVVEARKAIAHRVELASEAERNALTAARNKTPWLRKVKGSTLFLGPMLADDKLTVTRRGEFIEIDVGVKTYEIVFAHWYELCHSACELLKEVEAD